MFRKPILTLTLTLTITLIALAGTYLHAATPGDSSTNAPATVSKDGPGGGDPEPPGSSAVNIAMMLLQMGIE
jgi:hypothetical protein